MSYIELKNVTKKIKRNPVINNISLNVDRGTIVGLRGVNGSGKTMLLRIIAGLIYPSSGAVFVDSKELGVEIEFPRSIGVLIERPAFLEQYSGYKNLQILSSLDEQPLCRDDIFNLLDFVGLSDARQKKYRKYSLGMKQRLGIAAAVLGGPDLILLDEPTNALDVDGIEMLKKLIFQEKRRGTTVIIACHDSEFLSTVSDEIYVLEGGCIKEHIQNNLSSAEVLR